MNADFLPGFEDDVRSTDAIISNEGWPVLGNHAENSFGLGFPDFKSKNLPPILPFQTEQLPAAAVEEQRVSLQSIPLEDGEPPIGNVHRNPDRPRYGKSRHVKPSPGPSAFALRVAQFTRWLSAVRRAEIARRPRFRNQPYLRRSDEPNPDDFLP